MILIVLNLEDFLDEMREDRRSVMSILAFQNLDNFIDLDYSRYIRQKVLEGWGKLHQSGIATCQTCLQNQKHFGVSILLVRSKPVQVRLQWKLDADSDLETSLINLLKLNSVMT